MIIAFHFVFFASPNLGPFHPRSRPIRPKAADCSEPNCYAKYVQRTISVKVYFASHHKKLRDRPDHDRFPRHFDCVAGGVTETRSPSGLARTFTLLRFSLSLHRLATKKGRLGASALTRE
jgi:hypothetical protein